MANRSCAVVTLALVLHQHAGVAAEAAPDLSPGSEVAEPEVDGPVAPLTGSPPLSLPELLSFRLSASSFFEVSRESAPGATYVIDRHKLATSAGRTIADNIEMAVPGMQISRHLWTGSIIGVRGISIDNNAKTLVMLDGLNLNMRTHFGTSGLLSLPLMEDVESLEVSIGPGALVHGAGAINGYINLVPRDGAAHPGLEVSAELGPVESSGSVQTSYGLSYGDRNNLFLYAGFAGAGGFRPDRHRPWSCTGPEPRSACPYPYIESRDMGPSYKLTLNWSHGNLDVLALFTRMLLSTDGNALSDYYRFEDPFWLSAILAIRPRYTLSLTDKEDLVLAAAVEAQDYGFVPRHPERPGAVGDLPVIWNGQPRGGRESWGSFRALLKTIRLSGNSLAVGGEIVRRMFERKRQFFEGGAPVLTLEEAAFVWTELSAFLENTWTWRRLTVTGGLRFEHFDNPTSFQPDVYTEASSGRTVDPLPVSIPDQTALVARLGASWAVAPGTTVKGSYQQGFRNPDASYYTHWAVAETVHQQDGKASLAPLVHETMDSVELDLSHTVSPAVAAYLNGYFNRYRNLLAWKKGEETFLNVPRPIYSLGGELGADVVFRNLRLGLSYGHSRPVGYSDEAYRAVALTSTDLDAEGEPAGGHRSWTVFSPHQAKASLAQSLLGDRLSWSISAAFYSRVDDPRWAAGQANRFLLHAAVNYQVSRQVHVKLVLQNLTGNSVPASRLDNDLTQVGNLGIDQRLAYLSLGLSLR